MSGRTAKLIRRWASVTGSNYRHQKKTYVRLLDHDGKRICRRNMLDHLKSQ